uniref:ATP synthase F(0) complex subunit e, mitochondrial n=1 Tax=Prolemur simus TaxID=1328070 RepID=A0A8C8YNI5_PROSS
ELTVPSHCSLPQLSRYSALFLGVAYGATSYSYLKPRAEEEWRIAAEEKKKQDELNRIARELMLDHLTPGNLKSFPVA